MTPIPIAFPIAKQSPNHNVCVIFGQCQSVSCSSEEKKIPRLSLSREERSIFRMPPDTHTTLQFLIFHQVVQQVIIIVILYKASN